jgi:hypothetical protein
MTTKLEQMFQIEKERNPDLSDYELKLKLISCCPGDYGLGKIFEIHCEDRKNIDCYECRHKKGD